MNKDTCVAVIGLGYVGLPLAVEFGKLYKTIGYDLNTRVIDSYKKKVDPTGEVDESEFVKSVHLDPTSEPSRLKEADFIIVAVPTPIDQAHQPDLEPVRSAAKTAGTYMKKGAVVVFESTVYPGVTEDICVPIMESVSNMTWKKDFHVGYSPERINPGDKDHTLSTIRKVVSGDDPDTADQVAALYESIIKAGIHRTRTIKEAEAAKVIENTQRDLNIALMNELAVIFDKLGIDTMNVLEAAGTKWNFLPFRPGLVGGHCIGVDPYYLTYKAETLGYHPEVILAGRRINDSMGKYIAEKTVKMMITAGKNIRDQKVGILGLTFKEDCADLRNTRVVDIVNELKSYGTNVLVHDPLADPEAAMKYYGIELQEEKALNNLGALIVAVPHKAYRQQAASWFTQKVTSDGCLIDVKSMLQPDEVIAAGIRFWRL